MPIIYRVNEIFAGLEGEGHNPGTPTVRVRLQGCTVACKLRKICDQGTALDPTGGHGMSLESVLAAVFAFDVERAHPIPWVAISGGEPTEQNIEPLIWALQQYGKKVRLETSGLVRCVEGPIEYVRVSPKEPTPVRTKQNWGLELSVVWTGIEKLEEWEKWGYFAMRTLQPCEKPDGSTNVEAVIEKVLERPVWQLSLQTHKLLGLP